MTDGALESIFVLLFRKTQISRVGSHFGLQISLGSDSMLPRKIYVNSKLQNIRSRRLVSGFGCLTAHCKGFSLYFQGKLKNPESDHILVSKISSNSCSTLSMIGNCSGYSTNRTVLTPISIPIVGMLIWASNRSKSMQDTVLY